MTLDELKERIKAEIILHEGDVAQYQWQQLGLVQEAAGAGLSKADFFSLVNQVSLSVQADFGRIDTLKQAMLNRLRGQKGKLTNADLAEFSQEADRARLSHTFLVETWIPQLQSQLPPAEPEPVVPVPTPVATPPSPTPLPYPPNEPPPGETLTSMRQKVSDSLNDYGDRIPAPAIRSLFRTISYSEADLSVAIWNYLQIHQYQPLTELAEGSLRDKLTTTDWQVPVNEPVRPPKPPVIEPIEPVLPPPPPPIVRSFTATPARVKKGEPVTLEWEVENLLAVTIDDLGEGLSPKNRGWVKPSKTADYTLFDVNDNPLSTVHVEVEKPDRSGLYGVLFAAALLLIIYWFVKSSNSSPREPEPTQRTEQTSPVEKKSPVGNEAAHEPEATQPIEEIATDTTPRVAQTDNKPEVDSTPDPVDTQPTPEPEPQPTTPADARRGKYKENFGDRPYDKVELGTDEQGWRRARKNGRWGYINDADEWVIEPEYEAVTPFKGNTASVFLNGQLMTINRDGEQVRK